MPLATKTLPVGSSIWPLETVKPAACAAEEKLRKKTHRSAVSTPPLPNRVSRCVTSSGYAITGAPGLPLSTSDSGLFNIHALLYIHAHRAGGAGDDVHSAFDVLCVEVHH